MHTHVQVYEVCSRICIDYSTCIYYLFIIYVLVCAYMRRSGDDLSGLCLSFHNVDSGDKTLVIRLGSECLYLLSHLSGLTHVILI